MLRRRSRLLALFGVALAALLIAGCGRDDFNNDPRPAIPLEVTAKIDQGGVAVSPKEFGAGLVSLTVANLTADPTIFVLTGPVDAKSDEIPGNGTASLKIDMKTGSYVAGAEGLAVKPANVTVGPPRPSGSNDLLLP
jgi:hypothetical protein